VIRPIFRLTLTAAGLAIAAWLLPASVQIVSWGAAGPTRVAQLAPLATLWLALIVSSAGVTAMAMLQIKSGRSLDALSARLLPLGWLLLWLVPYLPWLPDRAPLLLIFAGPLRWAVAAIAIGGALREPIVAVGRAFASWTPSRAVIFVVSVAIYAGFGLHYAREMGFGGDEPHYLIITHSLLKDGDLDIANNHEQRDYRAFFPGELRPDFLRRGIHGEIYSIHAPGLPALVLPAYAIGGALGVVAFIALLAGFAALAVFELASAMAGPSVAALTWLATCLTIPFVPHAWLIYPELPGALVVAWAVLWLWRAPASVGRTVLHGLAFATLPWLHTKFAVFVALFSFFETVRLWPRIRHIVALLAPIAISGLAWLYSFYRMYGVVDPEAPYGTYTQMFVLARNIPRGTLGLLFDQKFGLLVYSPVYILALAGSWMMLRDSRTRTFAAALLVTAVAFFVSTTRLYMWWGGSSAPARFLVPMIPLLAPAIAIAIARATSVVGKAVVWVTLTVSVLAAVVTVTSPGQELLYSSPHGVAALALYLQGPAPLDVSLPTFTEENWRAPIGALAPWLASAFMLAVLLIWMTRSRRARSVFWTATGTLAVWIVSSAALVGMRSVSDRSSVVTRGRLELMERYDPALLHAADLTHATRLSTADVTSAAALSIRHSADDEIRNPGVIEGPFELPEGAYEARLWFDVSPPDGDAFVAVSDHVHLATTSAPFTNPIVLPFTVAIRTPVFVGVSNETLARAVRRVDIAPLSLVPRSGRDTIGTHVVEPAGGDKAGFIGYLDDHAYPEGGVFWTRGTEQARIVVVTGGATSLKLVLHVGPGGGPVEIEVGPQRFTVEMTPNETHDLVIPVASTQPRVTLAIRSTHAFRPSEADQRSGDQRSLGCQVRPLLY